MKTSTLSLLLSAVALFLTSCASQTPQARIAKHPQLFAGLSSQQKELVQRGRIDRGMPRDGVFLAWGNPDRVFEGSREGTTTERWDYTGREPVHTTHMYGGFGWGGYSRYSRFGFAAGPEVIFIPYRAATVWFRGGKVESWERVR